MTRWRFAAAAAVALAAFALFHATLLPGFDLGDTASFQATVSAPTISPRDAYPLYFAIGKAFLWTTGDEPARALNLASAVEAALACGLIVLAATALAGSLPAGIAAAVAFAGSYTFWSHAVIAEVYALHMVIVALTLWLLLEWSARPTHARLTCFFAAYALGFGNHLSTVLLLPGYTLFLLLSAPGGWRSCFTPRIVGLAVACAGAGALQYAWNIHGLYASVTPPQSWSEAIGTLWFDVTKADWRESTVMHVSGSVLGDRFAMYRFDLQQQFGRVAPMLALVGAAGLLLTNVRRAALMLTLYAATLLFAWGYNVGDAYVFFLPSHLVVALLIAPGIAWLARLTRRPASVAAVISLAVAVTASIRMYGDYPALDRSDDHRPAALLDAMTAGIDDGHAILLTDLNWQLQNGLSYFARDVRPEIAQVRNPEVLLYAPALVRDNVAIGRDVVLTDRARAELIASYGPLIQTKRDPRVPTPTLSDSIVGLPNGTRYVLAILKPTREYTLDMADVESALRSLAGGRTPNIPTGDYVTIAGLVGDSPTLTVGDATPSRRRMLLGGTPVEVRMDSWLSADTIRRMGFGHVIAARRHTLIIERGISFVAFDGDGRPVRTGYAGNIFAPQPRYLCYR